MTLRRNLALLENVRWASVKLWLEKTRKSVTAAAVTIVVPMAGSNPITFQNQSERNRYGNADKRLPRVFCHGMKKICNELHGRTNAMQPGR